VALALAAAAAAVSLAWPWGRSRAPVHVEPLPAPPVQAQVAPPVQAAPPEAAPAIVVPPPRERVAQPRARRTPRPVTLSLSSDPQGAEVCEEQSPERLGVTNLTLTLAPQARTRKLLVYRRGYRTGELTVPGDVPVTRSIKLRRLTQDDLQEPSPCR
jgi:hypothetical protein